MTSSSVSVVVPKVNLGSQGLVVSAQGLGCMGMSGNYGLPKPEPDMIKLIHHAVDSGVTFLDTSDVYGPHTNEILIGKALKEGGLRDKVQIATKFGNRVIDGKRDVCGDPEYVRSACEASLKRLDIDCIDLYYVHRIDIRVPIEVTMGELKKLVEEGKVKYIGLSEASASTIRRAHAVHPITAVQQEWSLWSRDLEDEIVPTCRELGIGIVPYSPIGRGFLAVGPSLVENLIEGDFRKSFPRFQNVDYNKTIFERVNEMATRKGCTAAQLALAWVHHQGTDVVPIPGTTKFENFNQNIGALSVKLTPEEMAELESFASSDVVKGDRHAHMQLTWINSETPPLSSWKVRVKANKRDSDHQTTMMPVVPKHKLGSQGLVVSAQGLGLGTYNPKPEPDIIKLIHHAIESGVTFLDTSDVYGPHTSEIVLGKALKGGLRDKVQVATKFGIRWINGKQDVCGDPAYVRSACEASLKRLDIDCIDLYYAHRIDTRVPIEATMGELKKLIKEGKVKYVGLSEACASTIRRAHAVHPITAVQNEWSLWSRDLEDEIVPTCRELGIGIVSYSPIGRGFLAVGPKLVENMIDSDFRKNMPRFQNVEHNKTVFERVNEMATRKGCTAAQLALAWVHHQGSDVVPIPGTTKLGNFNQNIGALSVKLTPEEIAELESFASSDVVKGERHAIMQMTWINSETPPLSSWKGI